MSYPSFRLLLFGLEREQLLIRGQGEKLDEVVWRRHLEKQRSGSVKRTLIKPLRPEHVSECGERVVCVMDEDAEGRRFPVLLRPREASGLAVRPGPGRIMGVVA